MLVTDDRARLTARSALLYNLYADAVDRNDLEPFVSSPRTTSASPGEERQNRAASRRSSTSTVPTSSGISRCANTR